MFGISKGSLPSALQHNFSQVPQAQIPRSAFDRSHNYKTTFDAGYLVPVYVDEALPGDTFNLSMTTFARLSTPIVPVMDNLYCDAFFFAVPIRLVWDNFKKFMGEQTNPGDSTSYTVPQVVADGSVGHLVNSLFDYMGVPTGIASLSTSALWSRSYNLIWNEWFRDENLQNSLTVDKGDSADTVTNYTLQRRGKRHDYFTSSLPWPQKGTAVTIPLGTSAPVLGIGFENNSYPSSSVTAYESSGATAVYAHAKAINPASSNTNAYAEENATTGYPNIRADLSNATAATINSLRQAFQLQKLYERDARGGTRYTEIVRAHFGVTSPDARLQRPEFLGGGSTQITMVPIPQTSVTTGTTPQGNLAATATFSHNGVGFTKSFTEHCILIGLVSVRADLNYQQGLNRMWSRSTRFDYYWPALSHIGEQSVLNKEIYCKNDSNDALVFGYQERYAEYRYKPNTITGQFRSTYSAPLDIWHLGQKFTSLPALNSTFIVENPPVSRIVAVNTTGSQFYLDAHFSLKCARPMPTYGVPGLIDHF